MRGSCFSVGLLHLIVLLYAVITTATPFPKEFAAGENGMLIGRACAQGSPCGLNLQLCCSAGQVCYTDANSQPGCTTTAPNTAITQGSTVTSTIICRQNLGENACSNTCCQAGQTCASPGNCVATGATYNTQIRTITSLQTATQVVAATVVASTVTVTPIATASSTTTTTTTASSGLDTGSIVGIVVGVIVGIVVLAWMCRPILNRSSNRSDYRYQTGRSAE